MKTAFVFPGQGAQFPGMGKDLYAQSELARTLFDSANAILGFSITDIMFEGTAEALQQTQVTQPAVFLHSVISALVSGRTDMDMVAGHSLGEFSALVVAGALSFEDGLRLVSQRANAMQAACEEVKSGMAAVLGLEDAQVEEICAQVPGVVPANYNCPGQLVISGTVEGVAEACEKLKAAGAKRAMPLAVSGGFHSPCMQSASETLQQAIHATQFHTPRVPVYQNVVAQAVTNPTQIQANLIAQLTGPVKWTQCVLAMEADGMLQCVEFGPGKVLQGLVKKIAPQVEVSGIS